MPPDPPSLGVLKHTLVGPLWGPTNTKSLDTPLSRREGANRKTGSRIWCDSFTSLLLQSVSCPIIEGKYGTNVEDEVPSRNRGEKKSWWRYDCEGAIKQEAWSSTYVG